MSASKAAHLSSLADYTGSVLDLVGRRGRSAVVRAWNGKRSRWYRSAMAQRGGRITAAGETHEVGSAPGDPELNGRIDEAYRTTYAGSPYLPPMVGAGPLEATMEAAPRDEKHVLDRQDRSHEHGQL
jgi:hypothetical protein